VILQMLDWFRKAFERHAAQPNSSALIGGGQET
jgi:hypothetical protein